MRWLRKHGFARDEQESDSNEPRVFTFDEMLAQVAAGHGTFEKVNNCHDDTQASHSETNPRSPPCDGAVAVGSSHSHSSSLLNARAGEKCCPSFSRSRNTPSNTQPCRCKLRLDPNPCTNDGAPTCVLLFVPLSAAPRWMYWTVTWCLIRACARGPFGLVGASSAGSKASD